MGTWHPAASKFPAKRISSPISRWTPTTSFTSILLIAATTYGVSDFIGGFASRRISALNVLLVSYPVGGALMALALPVLRRPGVGRTLAWSLAGGVAGLAGVALLYSAWPWHR